MTISSLAQIVICAAIAFITNALAYYTGFWSHLNFHLAAEQKSIEKVNKAEITWSDVSLLFTAFLIIQLLLLPLVWTMIQKIYLQIDTSNDVARWFLLCTIFVTTALLLILYFMRSDAKKAAIWGRYTPIFSLLAIGAATWLLSFPIVAWISASIRFIFSFFPQIELVEQVAVSQVRAILDQPLLLVASVVAIAIAVPVLEELLFRGFLQIKLKQYFPPYSAIALTSMVFTLFHFLPQQGMSNVELLPALFVLSCFLGYLREKYNSLWASIGLHSTFNAMSILMMLIFT